MKRIIKFRVFDKTKKEMHKVISIWRFSEEEYITVPDGDSVRTLFNNFQLMQFTGLKDKNGKEIYEGDYDNEGNMIKWCVRCSGWEFAQLDIPTKDVVIKCHRCDGNFFIEDHINSFEVIGNIYENP